MTAVLLWGLWFFTYGDIPPKLVSYYETLEECQRVQKIVKETADDNYSLLKTQCIQAKYVVPKNVNQ